MGLGSYAGLANGREAPSGQLGCPASEVAGPRRALPGMGTISRWGMWERPLVQLRVEVASLLRYLGLK